MITAVTACYSRRGPLEPYDEPKWAPKGVGAAYAFTQDRRWFSLGWTPGTMRNNLEMSPRLQGKAPKAAPHLLGIDGDDVLWLDASMMRTGRDVRSLFELVPPGGVGCFRHRFRPCVYEEATASVAPGFDRYVKEPILEQVTHYRRMGHPDNDGLYELGLVVWRGAQRVLGAPWLAEMMAFSSQDQLSFPVVCRRHGITPTVLPGTAVRNAWYEYVQHREDQ